MVKFHYKSLEAFNMIDYDNAIFSIIPEDVKDEFAYFKGRIISRGTVNKKMVRFSDRAISQAVKEFKPHPLLLEHEQSLKGMIGTVVRYDEDDGGLNLFAFAAKEGNADTLNKIKADKYGLIKMSIGGYTTSITCNACGTDIMKCREHRIGQKVGDAVNFGNVMNWKTKESTITLFPADEGTGLKQIYTGFSMLDDKFVDGELVFDENTDTFLNTDKNSKSDKNMTDDGTPTGSTVDVSNFASKEDFASLMATMKSQGELMQSMTAEIKAFKDERKALEEAEKKKIALALAERTGEKAEDYLSFDMGALGKMLSIAEKQKKVPGASAFVDHTEDGRSVNFNQKLSKEESKAIMHNIIFGAQKPSAKAQKYLDFYEKFSGNIGDRANNILREMRMTDNGE